MNHGQDVLLMMSSTANHRDFHEDGIPQLCEHGDTTRKTQGYNGACSRKQPRVRQHYEYRWF